MKLDEVLTRLGVKHAFMVVDFSFPRHHFSGFKSAYPHRFLHVPAQKAMAKAFLTGLASSGVWVFAYGLNSSPEFLDSTLHIKVLRSDPHVDGSLLEEQLLRFGPAEVLIPEEDSRTLELD